MALLLITGVAGTGKTLYALQKYIIPELKKGNAVYSNIDGLVLSRVAILFDVDIIQLERTYFKLNNPKRFWEEVPKNVMIVIDEGQNIFHNREWQDKDNIDCVKYLMEHRHYGHQVLMITPSVDTIDAGVRRVAEFTYKHKSFSMIGNKKTVKCAIFSQANTTMAPLQLFTWHHDTRIYDCYKSYFEEGTKEVKPRVNIFKNTKLIGLSVVVIIAIILAVRSAPGLARFMPRKHKQLSINNLPKVNNVSVGNGAYIMIGDSVIIGNGKYRREIK